jgi:hypothetical protein
MACLLVGLTYLNKSSYILIVPIMTRKQCSICGKGSRWTIKLELILRFWAFQLITSVVLIVLEIEAVEV